jgi:hypothetical protein
METIVVALIGAFSTIVTAVISSNAKHSGQNSVTTGQGSRTKTLVTLNLGATLTTLAVVITFLLFPISRLERNIEEDDVDLPLEVFLESPMTPAIERLKKMDSDAKAILAGAGPKEIRTRTRTYKVGDVLYAPEWQWIEIVYPALNREEFLRSDTCGLYPGGKLTIRGFSTERRSVLFEYAVTADTGGTACDAGTYFFYPYSNPKSG